MSKFETAARWCFPQSTLYNSASLVRIIFLISSIATDHATNLPSVLYHSNLSDTHSFLGLEINFFSCVISIGIKWLHNLKSSFKLPFEFFFIKFNELLIHFCVIYCRFEVKLIEWRLWRDLQLFNVRLKISNFTDWFSIKTYEGFMIYVFIQKKGTIGVGAGEILHRVISRRDVRNKNDGRGNPILRKKWSAIKNNEKI